MAEGGSANKQRSDPLPARRQLIINNIFAAIPAAERYQRNWAANARNLKPPKPWTTAEEAWKAHDLPARVYAKYPHNLFTQTQAPLTGQAGDIELWPAGMWVLPRGKKELSTQDLSQMRVKPNSEFIAPAMVGGRMRLVISKNKDGPYEDLDERHLHDLLPVNLQSIKCLLDGLAKAPKIAAGEPNWPDEVDDYGK